MFTGIILIGMSIISELYFHYIADFTLEEVPEDIFWRAEFSEVLNSMFLLIGGITLIIIYFVIRKR